MIPFRESLQERARALRRRIIFPEGGDERTLDAVARIQLAGLAQPVMIGDAEHVRRTIDHFGGNGSTVEVIDVAHDPRVDAFADDLHNRLAGRGWTVQQARAFLTDPLAFGAALVHHGAVHGCVAGAERTTSEVLRAVLRMVGMAQGLHTVSSAFYMIVPSFRDTDAPEVLTFTDAGVVPDPDAEQLADIAAAAASARRQIVGDEPRVAFLSYSTHGSADGATVQKVRAAVERFRRIMPDVAADGELQADAALIRDVARRKAAASVLNGGANVLVFPNLDAGNIAYKLVQRLARADAIGPILQGLARPCNDLSRGASAADIVDVACVTALLD